MNAVTIPRNITKGEELVIIPRKIYEALLRPAKTEKKDIVVKHTIRVPKKHEKFYNELDKELTERLREARAGNVFGPFSSAEEGFKFLENRRVQKTGNAS